jgi:hypothetical protein
MGDPFLKYAKKRVKKKKGFYGQLAAFVGVGFFFLAINLFTFFEEGPEIWFFWPLLPWSIGLIIHYLTVFGFPGNGALSPEWEERELKKEMNTLRRKLGEEEMRDIEPEEKLDLPELQKETSKDWRKDDLV